MAEAKAGAQTASASLYAKLAKVASQLGYIAKDGRNDFQKYNYMTAESVLGEVRKPLNEEGVLLLASVTGIDEREYTTSKDKSSVITTVHLRFVFVDAETGQTHESEWAGVGDDAADKGLGKAYTNAVKTFLRQQFLIPQGDDPEADTGTDQRAAGRQRGSQPRRQQPQAAATDVRSRLRAAYASAGQPEDLAMLKLDELGVEKRDSLGERIPLLTDQQAEVLIGELTRMAREQVKAA